MEDPLVWIARLFHEAGLPYALIGGHAVNVWTEPRVTADVDVTLQAGADDFQRIRKVFEGAGLTLVEEIGAELGSGPDFVRYRSSDGLLVLEIQTVKTALQQAVVDRAIEAEDGVRVATPEDLIVLKLIADRPKDRIDLESLALLPDLDWDHVARWAREWEVSDRLERLRSRLHDSRGGE